MKPLISTRSLASLAIVASAFTVTAMAHADSDVYFSVGVQIPGVHFQPAPVYVQPPPVYLNAPRHDGRYNNGWRPMDNGWPPRGQHWRHQSPYGDRDQDGIANFRDPDSRRHQWRQAQLFGPYGDLDRDGIRNRYDRDRDGDGIPNRFDRLPSNPYRR